MNDNPTQELLTFLNEVDLNAYSNANELLLLLQIIEEAQIASRYTDMVLSRLKHVSTIAYLAKRFGVLNIVQ